ncbi:MAG: HAD-IC family P-type ATPase, partial [Mycoplasma sp.]
TLVKDPNEKFFKAFCKGSPEKIKELCKPETIPENFIDILEGYTSKGLRVLALATKFVKMDFTQAQQVSQNFVEKNMIFLGLLIVQNKLKKATKSSIKCLDDAHLKMLMATGDNILTAISVSKECELISPNAKIYTCEWLKDENSNNNLVWNTVENFDIDKKDILINDPDKLLIDKNANESKCVEERFPPESFCDDVKNTRIENDDKVGDENRILDTEEKMNLSEVINIDQSNNIFNENDDFVIAVSGNTWEQLFKKKKKYLETKEEKYKIHYDTFRLVLKHGSIFARMAPDHKTLLVETLREENFNVMMCGDGANDCGALRAADVGVSLSPEEASIAAHFTSKIPDVSCLITLLREGKASLVTSIQTFKYMMMYSFIQFFSVTLLMIYQSYLSDSQFLVSDIFIIFPLAFFIAQTGSYEKL